MQTTIEFLDELKAKYGLKSDYAIAKMLGCGNSRISNYRSKRSTLGDDEAIEIAEKLGISPAYVLACVHFERANSDPQKAVWRNIMEKFGGIAAALFMGLGVVLVMGFESPNDALLLSAVQTDNLYIIRSCG